MARIGVLISAILAWLMPISRSAALVLTLEQALERARQENLTLQVEDIGLKMAASELIERQSDYIPALEMSVSYRQAAGQTEGLDLEESERLYTARITQKIPLGGRLSLYYQSGVNALCRTPTSCDPGSGTSFYVLVDPVRETTEASEYGLEYTHHLLKNGPSGPALPEVKEAWHDLRIQRESKAASLAQVLYWVTTAFYELLHAQEILRLERENLAISQRLMALADARLKLGLIAGMGLLSARVELAAAKQSLLSSLSARELARERLAGLLNVDTLLEADGRFQIPEFPLDLETAIGTALAGNRSVIRLKREIDKQKLTLAIACNNLLPQLDLSARVSRSHLEAGETQGSGHEVQVGLAFHHPFHDRGLRQNRRQQEFQLQALRLRLEELQASIRREITQVFARMGLCREQLSVLSRQADTLKRRFDLVMRAFDEGLVPIDEVHDTRQDLIQSRRQVLGVNLSYQRLRARVHLLAGEGLDGAVPFAEKTP